MARDILFKAKRIDNGEWVEGFYFCMVHDDGRHIHHFIMPLGSDLSLGTPIEKIQVEIDINTLCQYTGLTDMHGNKIWENDVVEVWWKQRTLENDYVPQRHKAIIEFGNPNSLYSWGYQLHFVKDFPFNPDILLWIDMEESGAYCEVIGNIFDNPKLLGGAENG